MEEEERGEEVPDLTGPRVVGIPGGDGEEEVSAGLEREALAVFRARNEAAERSAVGDLAERLLEQESGLWKHESGDGGSGDLKKRLSTERMAPEGSAREKTAAERLYGRVNAVWLRQADGESRSVVVTVQEDGPASALNVRDVDRAFQRDARRYDGGLHLL